MIDEAFNARANLIAQLRLYAETGKMKMRPKLLMQRAANVIELLISPPFDEVSALAHPSPSPEQGDDLVQRLTEVYEHDWRISFLAHTSDTAREAATELSALRARVAELEARATPQAGASEAEPAWGPAVRAATRQSHASLYATPPDSDAVRALREVQTIILYGDGDTSDRLNACETVVLAALSNQGSSSNGQ